MINSRLAGAAGKILILIVLPAAAAGAYLLHSTGLMPLFPNPALVVEPYDDTQDMFAPGNSRIERFEAGNSIVLSYTLKKGTLYPYAGLRIHKAGAGFLFDRFSFVGRDDYIRIRIRSTKSKTLRFHILTDIEGFSKPHEPITFLYMQHEIPVWQNRGEYLLRLGDFATPVWWYEIHHLTSGSADFKPDFSRIAFILIERESTFPLDLTDTVEIDEISLKRNAAKRLFFCAGGLLLYCTAFLILFLNKRRADLFMRRMNAVVTYRPLSFEERKDPYCDNLIAYIRENLFDPDLTADRAASACGLSTVQSGKIIKKKFGLTFPQYLNSFRINETKRLLETTDMPVTDIAMTAGYNNISYFNNIFRRYMNTTPGEYRKKAKDETAPG